MSEFNAGDMIEYTKEGREYYERFRGPKLSLKSRIKIFFDLRVLEFKTSQFWRNRNLKKLREKIPETSEKELETLLQMKGVINSLDLNDPCFGDVLEDDLIKMLDEKIEKAKQLAEAEKQQEGAEQEPAESEIEEGGMQF